MNTSTNNEKLNEDTFLNEITAHLGLKNDAQLAKALKVGPSAISKIRHRRAPITPALLIYAHEATGISIRDLRTLMGDMRPHTGKSAIQASM